MKKFLNGIYITAILFSFFTFSSCHNMCEDLKDVIGEVCWYDKLEWKDVSGVTYNTGTSAGISQNTENGQNIVSYTTRTSNYRLSNLGSDVKGYEVDVKLSSCDYAGIELFGSGYNCYTVLIRKENTSKPSQSKMVEVYYDRYEGSKRVERVKYFSQANVVSDPSSYNTIKMQIQKDRTVNIYINDNSICTIPDNEFAFGAFALYANGSCSYKIRKILH